MRAYVYMYLIVRYKYFLVILIIIELVIMNISLLIYMILEDNIELGVIFIYYLVFRICESDEANCFSFSDLILWDMIIIIIYLFTFSKF
jgi:hypothetical protein